MKRVLIVDDDESVRNIVAELVSTLELSPISAKSGKEGLRLALDERPDVILLDVSLGDTSGFELCKQMKENPVLRKTPLIMVTAETDVESRVKGLEMGADDYLCKPFDRKELSARIHACLRRVSDNDENDKETELSVGNLRVNGDTFQVWVDQEEVHLTPREFELLYYFLKHPDQIVNRKKLLSDLWPGTAVGERTVDTHITNLRHKLKSSTHIVETSHGVGYILKKQGRSKK